MSLQCFLILGKKNGESKSMRCKRQDRITWDVRGWRNWKPIWGILSGAGPMFYQGLFESLCGFREKDEYHRKWSLWKPRSQEYLKVVNNLHATRSSIHPSLYPCSRFNSHASWRIMLWNKTVPVSELHFMWNLLSSKNSSFHKRNITSSQLQHIIILSNSTQPKLQEMMNVNNSWHEVLSETAFEIIVEVSIFLCLF